MKKQTFFLLIFTIISHAIKAQTPAFYGVTYDGGDNGLGTIFKTDTTGLNYGLLDTFEIVYDGRNGQKPQLLEVNGVFYGVIGYGGENSGGVLFEFNPSNNAYLVKHHFSDSTGTRPECHLLLGSNGKIYGTTIGGGSYNRGTLFEYNILTDSLTRKISFYAEIGANPNGKIIESTPGIIHGLCRSGGEYNDGVLYEYSMASNTIVVLDDFNEIVNGRYPTGGLMKANNGKLYGLCTYGGLNNYGTLFEFDFTTDSIKNKYDLNLIDGRNPNGNFIQAANGKLYATTNSGGSATGSGRGTIIEYDIAQDKFSKLLTFSSFSSGTGYNAFGDLIETDTPGKYLLCLRGGGRNSSGSISIFDINTNTVLPKAYFDTYSIGHDAQGNVAKSSVTGKYYGITSSGGSGNNGVIYMFDNVKDTIIKIKDLSPSVNGKEPKCDLFQASNGKIYGTTLSGGTGHGVIFEYDPITMVKSKVAQFNGENGSLPRGSLVEVNGEIYGTTYQGGENNSGVIYKYNHQTKKLSKLKDLNVFGRYPIGGLILGSNGNLYSTTVGGGTSYLGNIIEYNILLDTIIEKGSFGEHDKGIYPYSNLIQAKNGNLYGTTLYGGEFNMGTVYTYDFSSDSIRTIASFNGLNGQSPMGELIQISTGEFFGMTTTGNSSGDNSQKGVVYEIDITNDSIIHRADFERNTTGYGSSGGFIEGNNGKLYGLSRSSYRDKARVLEFNPLTYDLKVTVNLTGFTDGSLLQATPFKTIGIQENNGKQEVMVYPNPSNSNIHLNANEEKINELSIFDVSGRKMEFNQDSKEHINISDLKPGVYFITAKTQSGIYRGKFIKN